MTGSVVGLSVSRKLAEKIAQEPPGIRTVAFADFGCVLASKSNHRPTPAIAQLHHVWPMGMGGPEDGERVPLCGTHHLDVHEAIRALVAGRKVPRGIGRSELLLAREAVARSTLP